jgi:hypothetical protein
MKTARKSDLNGLHGAGTRFGLNRMIWDVTLKRGLFQRREGSKCF